ncbi:hypothetical protein H6F88_12895 [Oculatella sp. FACHB-28]|uniref:hypothetical protein n=1 Tax=Oculatella sp. FACHB-28 TaxID=2692845 RepID=UPI0016850D57|nr:hypothetical protein [Oculatella sp. FACHB-28]MBD2056899.1 hypothetical protein [Oculatella sp. FACHB-28]
MSINLIRLNSLLFALFNRIVNPYPNDSKQLYDLHSRAGGMTTQTGIAPIESTAVADELNT